jgi:hypothetical protein
MVYATSGLVRQNLTDKMMTGIFEFESTIANANVSTYFKYVNLHITDYLGNQNPVFIGFFPSSTKNFRADRDNETFSAFDHAWYLTMQYLSDDDLTLLSFANQVATAQKKYYQAFNKVTPPVPPYYVKAVFEVGDTVLGATSSASGIIYEVNYAGSYYFRVKSITNTAFTAGENLTVNNVVYGTADGATLDETGTVTFIRPEEYVIRLLGGSNFWRQTTGIEPYRINSTSSYYGPGLEKPDIDFIFDQKDTKIQAIDKICQYLEYVFLVKPRIVGTFVPGVINQSEQSAYFVKETDIDDPVLGLDLPAEVTITNPDTYLVSPVTEEVKGEEKYNRVIVRCQSLTGYWFTGKRETTAVIQGDELPIEYYEINPDCSTQAEADARALDLFTYYSAQIKSWKATFNLRADFRLLQKLTFSGFWGEVETATVSAGGSGYSVGDVLTVVQAGASGGMFLVTDVSGDAVTSVTRQYAGKKYTTANALATTSSPGSGCTLNVTASGDDIPDGTYRIVGIEYNFANGGIINQVLCTLVLDGQFKAYLNLNRVFTSAITESQIIAREEIRKAGQNEVGTVISANRIGGILTYSPYQSGSGYHVGDIITVIQSGGSGGTFRVDSITGSGVETFSLLTSGSGYTVANMLSTSVSPSGGTLFKINILSVMTDTNVTVITENGVMKVVRGF